MRYTSSPGFDSRWQPNILILYCLKPVKERGNWRVRLVAITTRLMKHHYILASYYKYQKNNLFRVVSIMNMQKCMFTHVDIVKLE